MSMRAWTVVMVVAGGLIACGGAADTETDGSGEGDVSFAQPDAGAPADVSVIPDAEPVDDAPEPSPDIVATPDTVEAVEDTVEAVEDTVEAVEDTGAEDAGVEDAGAEDAGPGDTLTTEPDAEPPCVPACAGKACGDDGCGGACGVCADGETCNDQGTCGVGCAPTCAPFDACGDDGCGGSCGSCSGGGTCLSGVCCGPGPHHDCECWDDADCAATSDACEAAEVCNDTGGCETVPDSALECADGLVCIDSACVDCDPSGTWVLETTSASPPGEGCGPEGVPAQGPNTKTFVVTAQADGSFLAETAEPMEPEPEVLITLVGADPCSFAFSVTATIDFPAAGGEEASTVSLQYLYTVSLSDGLYLGTGTVQTSTTTESGIIQQDCTEAISVSGTLTPAG